MKEANVHGKIYGYTNKKITYANLFKPKICKSNVKRIIPKPVLIIHSEQSITQKSSEITSLIIQENLQYAVIHKFSYGKAEYNGVEVDYSQSMWH